jgi:hypothetical protein
MRPSRTAWGCTLNDADLGHDLVLVFTPRPLLDKLAKLKDPPAVPAEYRAAVAALERVTAVVAVLDGLGVLLKAAKPLWPGVRAELLMGIDNDLRNVLLATADEVVNAPRLTRDGAVVTLAVGRPKGIGCKK